MTYAQVSAVKTQLTQVCWMLQLLLLSCGQAPAATTPRLWFSSGVSVSLARLSFSRSFLPLPFLREPG